MSPVFWLAPIVTRNPFTIGSERIHCAGERFQQFRERVQQLSSPRFLLMFKSELLLSDELSDDDLVACGNMEISLPSFADCHPIVFDHSPFVLSHCAEAFIDRLPTPKEWRLFLHEHLTYDGSSWSEDERVWLDAIARWSNCNYEIVLIREE
jgi:hypothetical protein